MYTDLDRKCARYLYNKFRKLGNSIESLYAVNIMHCKTEEEYNQFIKLCIYNNIKNSRGLHIFNINDYNLSFNKVNESSNGKGVYFRINEYRVTGQFLYWCKSDYILSKIENYDYDIRLNIIEWSDFYKENQLSFNATRYYKEYGTTKYNKKTVKINY